MSGSMPGGEAPRTVRRLEQADALRIVDWPAVRRPAERIALTAGVLDVAQALPRAVGAGSALKAEQAHP